MSLFGSIQMGGNTLQAMQIGLQVVGNNIANANTPGYVRQEAIYAPASEVAGDFYDFVPIDDGSVGILVADVSGHGVPAALVASMLKVAVAGHILRHGACSYGGCLQSHATRRVRV